MKLRILSVAHKMPAWVEEACAEYTKRMPREMSVQLITIKPEKRADIKSEAVQLAESKRIFESAGQDYLIACDERGQAANTRQLAEKMKHWQMLGKDVSLVIGGADGLHPSVVERANWVLSLSALTLPHAFVRILLCEQLYRAHTVNCGHPYHKE